jgi:hypothetical protein
MTTQRRGKVVISNVVKASPTVIHTTDNSGVPNLFNGQPVVGQPAPPPIIPTAGPPTAVLSLPSGSPAPPTAIGAVSSNVMGGLGSIFLGPNLAAAIGAPPMAPPSAILSLGPAPTPAPAPTSGGTVAPIGIIVGGNGPPIPIAGPVPPTLSLGQAQSAINGVTSGDPNAINFVSGTLASAVTGHPVGQANAAVLAVAQRLQILASFVGQFVGQAQAQQVLTGAHLSG